MTRAGSKPDGTSPISRRGLGSRSGLVDASARHAGLAGAAAHQGDAGFHPVKTSEPRAGVHVYDLGQNFAGWPQITVRGAAGAQVRLDARRAGRR